MELFPEKYSQAIEKALERYYERYTAPENLYSPARYILSLGGKRIRPSLVLMAAESFGVPLEKATDAAIAIEVFHNFSLVHDDIMDRAPLRRGHETVHMKWNGNTAILSGDVMMIQAYELFESYPKDIFRDVVHTFNRVARLVCEGQQMDMDFEKEEYVPMEQYIRMIEMKTAVLLGGALAIGAIIGGASTADVEKMYDFGRCIGLAYQLTDDYLDTFGCEKTFGKRIGGDILEAKKTFLYITAFDNTTDKGALRDAFSITDEEEKITAVRTLYRKAEADKAIEKSIAYYTDKALSCADSMPFPAHVRDTYRRLAVSLVERKV